MRINFYNTMLSEDNRTILVKERGVNYGIGKICSPDDTVRMMKELLYLDKLAEEHCYMAALNSTCKIIGIFLISKGTVSSSLLSAREVYMRAVHSQAAGILKRPQKSKKQARFWISASQTISSLRIMNITVLRKTDCYRETVYKLYMYINQY